MRRIAIAQPCMDGNESAYVMDCMQSNWISSSGAYIDRFEQAFAEYIGVKHAITVSNGTTALHLALVGLGLDEGDEVIVPTFSFIATANAVTYCGAKVVFVDSCPETFNIDPQAIAAKITPRTKGIIAVHLYGHPAQMDQINQIAQQHGLWVVEDAAEGLGALYHQRKVGSLGHCAAFSFFGNKIITTGEGGMVTTNDDILAERIRMYRGHGMDPKRRYWFPVVGFNYRMTNPQAAIGLAQIERLEHKLAQRRQLNDWYDQALSDISDQIKLVTTPEPHKSVLWMYTLYLKNGTEALRDALMQRMAQMGIETRPTFYPMHQMPAYDTADHCPVVQHWSPLGINLPTHLGLTQDDVQYVADSLKLALSELQAPAQWSAKKRKVAC